MYKLQFFNT